jgi:hypothetical protein
MAAVAPWRVARLALGREALSPLPTVGGVSPAARARSVTRSKPDIGTHWHWEHETQPWPQHLRSGGFIACSYDAVTQQLTVNEHELLHLPAALPLQVREPPTRTNVYEDFPC